MNPRLTVLAVATFFLVGCFKADPAADKPLPKRNTAEALGFSTGEDYAQPVDRPAPAPVPTTPPVPDKPVPYTPIARTLTNKDGRKVEVLLLSRTATSVTFLRQADQVEFTFALDKLSAADREYLSTSEVPLKPAP